LKVQTKAYLYAACAVACWSTVASAFKLALRELDYVQLLFFSSAVSTCVLFLVVLVQRKWRDLAGQSRRDLTRSAGLGLINPFVYYLILFKAYDLLPAQEAQPLNYAWPIVLSILAVPLLKQKMRMTALVGLLVSFAGVLVIATRGDVTGFTFANPLGTGLALLSTVFWASFWLANVRDARDPAVKLFTNFAFGTVYVAAFVLATSRPAAPSYFALGTAAYVGVFEMGITFFVWLKALSFSDESASVAGLVYLSPFASLVLIHFVVGEVIYPSSVVGLALIVGGILIQRVRVGHRAGKSRFDSGRRK
jgi:drug/metabolite transporter (DMT)-like permease